MCVSACFHRVELINHASCIPRRCVFVGGGGGGKRVVVTNDWCI